MKIVWIIDNKFRELYGLYDLKKKLLEHNIKLYLFPPVVTRIRKITRTFARIFFCF